MAMARGRVTYEVTVEGEPGMLLGVVFEDLEVEADGPTRFMLHVRDEAEVVGLLQRLQDFNLHVVSLRKVRPRQRSRAPRPARRRPAA
jgi:hypothetical protein